MGGEMADKLQSIDEMRVDVSLEKRGTCVRAACVCVCAYERVCV